MSRIRLAGAVGVVVVALVAAACSNGGGTTEPETVPPEIEPTAEPSEPSYRIDGEGTGRVVEVVLDAVETVQEIAPGVEYHVWTFGGTAPGPVIRVTVGDTVRFAITNRTTMNLAHSMDFHAAQTPWDRDYQPVAPGDTLTFDWVARFPGVFMYHCGVPPVLHHIANGMYGAIVVEPEEGVLEPAREYVLVSSEFYPGAKPSGGVFEGDPEAMEAVRPEYVVFDGRANRYLDAPLVARPGELIRLWVMNGGPTLTNAFHVIGALFDHVYPDGNPTSPLNGIQTWNVPPGAGAMFELTIPDEGLYPFVTHSFAYTGRGGVGVLAVSADAPEAPGSYPVFGNPFDGGVTETDGFAATPPPGGGGEGGGDPGTEPPDGPLAVEMAISGFIPSEIEATEGAIEIAFVNLDAFPHDFTIDALGLHLMFDASEERSETFEAGPGSYTFYCSIPGHREAGMEGTLTVSPAAAH